MGTIIHSTCVFQGEPDRLPSPLVVQSAIQHLRRVLEYEGCPSGDIVGPNWVLPFGWVMTATGERDE